MLLYQNILRSIDLPENIAFITRWIFNASLLNKGPFTRLDIEFSALENIIPIMSLNPDLPLQNTVILALV